MKRLVLLLTAVSAAAALPPDARAGDTRLTLSFSGSLTTSSKLFPNPDAADEIVRGGFSPINSILGLGADARMDIAALGVRLGLSAEYLVRSVDSEVPNTSPRIPVEDGYVAVPIELTAFFDIPVGGDRIDFYMGGGAGVYLGGRRYRYAGVEAVTLDRRLLSGIHVLTGLEVAVHRAIALRTELKFRSIQLETLQRFPSPAAVYDGTTVPLPRDEFSSRIQVDGMHLSLGLAFRLP